MHVLHHRGPAAREVCFGLLRSSVLHGGDPSDGHPQEELTPDFAHFRPLSHNNQTWLNYWPELEV